MRNQITETVEDAVGILVIVTVSWIAYIVLGGAA